jgi:hypothetical protein
VIRFVPRRLVLSLCLVCAAAGCSLNFDATHLGVPATMASAAGTPAEGQPFSVTSHAVYGFWGLTSFSKPSLQKALAAQLVGGKQIADLRIKVRSRLGDLIVTALTLGLIVPRAVTFEGVVVPQ